MKLSKPLGLILILLSLVMLFYASTSEANSISISGIFLGEPDVFVPGVGLNMEFPVTRSLGLFTGTALFFSGSWDLIGGVIWHASQQASLYLQTFLLFDVIDGFIPQLGVGVRWSFSLSRYFLFFNELGLNIPLTAHFLQPTYIAGFLLSF